MMTSSWPKIILFGDSITQFSFGEGGWGAFIADKLQRKCDVVNRGLSGYNTSLAKLALPRLLPKSQIPQVSVLTLFMGANDAALEELYPQQYISVSSYVANMKAMIDYLQEGGLEASKIVLITPPPIYGEGWKKHCQTTYGVAQNRTNANTGLYAKACCTVAKDLGIEVLDIYTIMQQEPKWERYLLDGLHLSPDGNQFLGEQLWKMLEPKTRDLPMQLPDWKDVDPNNPEEALLK
ncbi:isoamyl acetate-hydrolyzing esterase 1 homolog isoform X1 [Amphiura filiformis]|uniref:isoamyl acetate-hydrolyzing esterase 1 homolog isoform X1 n=1 Tax=Amphiura filiformis TaxID=82378 RepID=UPI003B219FAE